MAEIYEKQKNDNGDVEYNKEDFIEERKRSKHKLDNSNGKKNIFLIIIAILISLIIIGFAFIYFAEIPIVEYKGEKVKSIEYGSIYKMENWKNDWRVKKY